MARSMVRSTTGKGLCVTNSGLICAEQPDLLVDELLRKSFNKLSNELESDAGSAAVLSSCSLLVGLGSVYLPCKSARIESRDSIY